MNAKLLVIAMLTLIAATRQFATQAITAAPWLDSPTPASWNTANGSIPTAPKVLGSVDRRCKDLARPVQLDEDRRVHDRGWDLVDAFQGGWQLVVIRGTAGYDGMCRPLKYQDFVFARGIFAGTLAPQPMDSRTDGALQRVFLQSGRRLTAQYSRYAASDALCCPSRSTTVTFDVSSNPSVLRPFSASTSKP